MSYFLVQGEYIFRILLAALCGMVIGFERKNRKKEAGIRTHIIVALASALMMVISKYGFDDIIMFGDVRLDPSRVASQIVSGIGFLGAGMIFVHRSTVKGLTTAAGIWATCGIGMAIGAGMYVIGIASTIIIFIVQIILHKDFKIFKNNAHERVTVIIKNNSESLIYIQDAVKKLDSSADIAKISKLNGDVLSLEIEINTGTDTDISIC